MKPGLDPAADLADMLEALGHDRKLFSELVELFLKEAAPLLARLRSAVAAGDDARLARAAHRLRGSVAQFSAGEASEALGRLEQIAETGDLRGAAEALQLAERALTSLIRAMRPYRDRGKSLP